MQVVLVAVGVHQLAVALEALEFFLGLFVALLLVGVEVCGAEAYYFQLLVCDACLMEDC